LTGPSDDGGNGAGEVMDDQDNATFYRKLAHSHFGSAQECLDYASMATHPQMKQAWKRVADCHQDLAIALEHLATVITETGEPPVKL
jgi:hypothetical protein